MHAPSRDSPGKPLDLQRLRVVGVVPVKLDRAFAPLAVGRPDQISALHRQANSDMGLLLGPGEGVGQHYAAPGSRWGR
jgi:hypothetical protein